MPKSIRQKRILSVAAEHPNESIENIAERISTASPDVVESVLSEYGDPAATEPSSETANDGTTSVEFTSSADENTTGPDALEDTASAELEECSPDFALTKARRETLKAIRANPEATQRELADQLGVTAPTINNRVNAIPGFEWENRRAFAETVFGSNALDEAEVQYRHTDLSPSGESEPNVSKTNRSDDHMIAGESPEQFERLLERLDTIVGLLEDGCEPVDTFGEAEFVHKIILASIESETISRDEEIELIRRIT